MSISKNQTFYDSKSNLKKENSFHVTEVLDSNGKYDDMFSKTHCTVAENETFVTVEKDKSWIDNTKSLTIDNARDVSSVTSIFTGNSVSLLHGKNNPDKKDTSVLHLNKKMLKMSISNTNLEDILKLSNVPTCSRQNISFEQQETFYPIFQKMTSSNTLANEIIVNTHITSKRRLEKLEKQKENTQDGSHKLNYVLENDFFQQPPISALDFINRNSKENQELNLLCVFTDEAGKEETFSNFNKLRHDEDIRMILPMAWNIVVANNVLTISNENNQDIRIYFRNPLNAKFDYKFSNLFSNKKFRFKSATDETSSLKERFRKKKINSPFSKTKVNQFIEPFNWRKNKAVHKSPKQIKQKKIRNDSFLLLREPILFNCIERNRKKQVLMYKAHSAAKDGSKDNFLEILEDLLAKSIHYDGEPVYLVSEPLKLMTRLKKEEGIRGSNVENNRICKHHLIESTIYKKLLIHKQMQKLRDAQYEKQWLRTALPKNDYPMHMNTINEISNEPVITTRSCNPPKNFSTLFVIKDFDMHKNIFEGTYASQMSTEPFVTRDSCSDLAKNFCASVTRRNFDTDELFGGHKSNFHRRLGITELKHVNCRKLVSSVFKHFFHFYSLIGGNLRSGAVITRSSSNYWLKVAGVATDSCTLRYAGELFTTVAGQKVVLNIFDYIKFLQVFARNRGIFIAELVKQLMVCEELSKPEFSKGKCRRCMTLKNRKSESREFFHQGDNLQVSQSLPNLWPPKVDSTRSSLSEEIV